MGSFARHSTILFGKRFERAFDERVDDSVGKVKR